MSFSNNKNKPKGFFQKDVGLIGRTVLDGLNKDILSKAEKKKELEKQKNQEKSWRLISLKFVKGGYMVILFLIMIWLLLHYCY